MLVDGDNLEVKRLLSYRKQFLYYIDMLETYEVGAICFLLYLLRRN